MDVNGKLKPIMRSSSQKESGNGRQVVVEISRVLSSQETRDENGYSVSKENRVDSQTKEPMDSSIGYGGSPLAPTANKPPKIPSSNGILTQRKSLKRSTLSKSKSRFGNQPAEIDSDMFEDNDYSLRDQIGGSSSRSSVLNTPKGQNEEEDDEEIYEIEKLNKDKHKKVKVKTLIKWVVVLCIIGFLVASLTVKRLKNCFLWGLEIWKWCLLATVTLCGMIFTNWVMNVIVFLIEGNFLLKKKVLYFVHGLKKSVQVTLWLTLILVTWVSLFDGSNHVSKSRTAGKILDVVTWTLVTLLIGALLCLVKTLLLKILASKFHMNRFFDRIQESVFHHHVLQTLSKPSKIGVTESTAKSSSGRLSLKSKSSNHKKVIDMGKIHQLKREKVSAWTMKVLVDAVTSSEMSISQILDESYEDVADGEITNEMEVAKLAAYRIFNNVALPGNK